jgi:membrane protease subunit HflK
MKDDDEVIIDLGNRYNFPPIPRKKFLTILIVIGAIIFIWPFFFTIQPEELGVIQRFGKHVRTVEPGLNMRIPWGIEKLTKVKVRTVFREEFGFRTLSSGVSARYSPKDYDEESLMLTGDLNIASVEWIVQYQIKDPVAYLFRVRNVEETIRNLSEASMRQIVGDRSVDEVIILNRQEIAFEVHTLLQSLLDRYETGVIIRTINLQNVVPPKVVQPAFNDVNSAMQEEERIVNEARQEYNRIIPQARGKARQTVEEAHGYAINRVNQARGDADKFIAIHQNYRLAQNVTKQRLYLETMEEIMPKLERVYIVDERQQSIIPFMDMGRR